MGNIEKAKQLAAKWKKGREERKAHSAKEIMMEEAGKQGLLTEPKKSSAEQEKIRRAEYVCFKIELSTLSIELSKNCEQIKKILQEMRFFPQFLEEKKIASDFAKWCIALREKRLSREQAQAFLKEGKTWLENLREDLRKKEATLTPFQRREAMAKLTIQNMAGIEIKESEIIETHLRWVNRNTYLDENKKGKIKIILAKLGYAQNMLITYLRYLEEKKSVFFRIREVIGSLVDSIEAYQEIMRDLTKAVENPLEFAQYKRRIRDLETVEERSDYQRNNPSVVALIFVFLENQKRNSIKYNVSRWADEDLEFTEQESMEFLDMISNILIGRSGSDWAGIPRLNEALREINRLLKEI